MKKKTSDVLKEKLLKKDSTKDLDKIGKLLFSLDEHVFTEGNGDGEEKRKREDDDDNDPKERRVVISPGRLPPEVLSQILGFLDPPAFLKLIGIDMDFVKNSKVSSYDDFKGLDKDGKITFIANRMIYGVDDSRFINILTASSLSRKYPWEVPNGEVFGLGFKTLFDKKLISSDPKNMELVIREYSQKNLTFYMPSDAEKSLKGLKISTIANELKRMSKYVGTLKISDSSIISRSGYGMVLFELIAELEHLKHIEIDLRYSFITSESLYSFITRFSHLESITLRTSGSMDLIPIRTNIRVSLKKVIFIMDCDISEYDEVPQWSELYEHIPIILDTFLVETVVVKFEKNLTYKTTDRNENNYFHAHIGIRGSSHIEIYPHVNMVLILSCPNAKSLYYRARKGTFVGFHECVDVDIFTVDGSKLEPGHSDHPFIAGEHLELRELRLIKYPLDVNSKLYRAFSGTASRMAMQTLGVDEIEVNQSFANFNKNDAHKRPKKVVFDRCNWDNYRTDYVEVTHRTDIVLIHNKIQHSRSKILTLWFYDMVKELKNNDLVELTLSGTLDWKKWAKTMDNLSELNEELTEEEIEEIRRNQREEESRSSRKKK